MEKGYEQISRKQERGRDVVRLSRETLQSNGSRPEQVRCSVDRSGAEQAGRSGRLHHVGCHECQTFWSYAMMVRAQAGRVWRTTKDGKFNICQFCGCKYRIVWPVTPS